MQVCLKEKACHRLRAATGKERMKSPQRDAEENHWVSRTARVRPLARDRMFVRDECANQMAN